MAASGTLTELYVADPPRFPDLNQYAALGLDLVEPAEADTTGGYWQTLSWEEVDTYPADMILAGVREGSIDVLLDQMPTPGLQLPAVEADQIVPWEASSAVGYGNAAANLDALAAVESADPDVA
jgi:iron complex transport system substrate-binding protein